MLCQSVCIAKNPHSALRGAIAKEAVSLSVEVLRIESRTLPSIARKSSVADKAGRCQTTLSLTAVVSKSDVVPAVDTGVIFC